MSRSYSLDPKAASQAGTSNFITETGKYKGKFTRAEIVISQQDTEGVELSFVADDGRRSDFLSLWTYNADGQALPSLKALNAIMACLRLREIQPEKIIVTDNNGTRQANGFPQLMNKPIGVLLQREEYEKSKANSDGSPIIGFKFNLIAPFEASSELTAGEILAKKTAPEQLPKMVALLKDRPMQARKPARTASTTSGGGSFEDMDDDIPF